MKKYNIFLCYRGDSSGLLANNIYSELNGYKNSKLKIFYAPRVIGYGQNFVEECEKHAANVSLMILFVTEGFFAQVDDPEDVVGKEIRCALSNKNCKFLPILIRDASFSKERLNEHYTKEEIDRISHINAISFRDVYSFDSTLLLGPILESLAISKEEFEKGVKNRSHISDNHKGDFFSVDNAKEERRLALQQQLLLKYDMPVYEKLLSGKEHLNVLDLGSATGLALMKRLGDRKEVDNIIGLEYDADNVKKANETYGNDHVAFYQCDVESEDFIEQLEDIMAKRGIEKFHFINILALISHLKNPAKVLRQVRKVCADDAVIIIRNIDDGLNLAYPDEEGNFKKALGILSRCSMLGYRLSGREVYSMLVNRGYKDIKLEKISINTVGMDDDDKEALFATVFRFIKNGIRKELEVDPENEEFLFYQEWYDNVYPELETRFMDENFLFNFGFMIYTARVR